MATTVLIVDDHSAFRSSARRLLEADGFEVVGEAADGAVRAYEAAQPPRTGPRPARPAASGHRPASPSPQELTAADTRRRRHHLDPRRRRLRRARDAATARCGFVSKAELSGAALEAPAPLSAGRDDGATLRSNALDRLHGCRRQNAICTRELLASRERYRALLHGRARLRRSAMDHRGHASSSGTPRRSAPSAGRAEEAVGQRARRADRPAGAARRATGAGSRATSAGGEPTVLDRRIEIDARCAGTAASSRAS